MKKKHNKFKTKPLLIRPPEWFHSQLTEAMKAKKGRPARTAANIIYSAVCKQEDFNVPASYVPKIPDRKKGG